MNTKTRQDKTRQDKTRQDKTRQDKTRQDKTRQEPLVSIITPVYNRKEELQRALRSMENSSCRDFEHIIVNDGSTVDLDQIVNEYIQRTDVDVLYLKKENGGVHTARNLAIRNARGKYIMFLDSDDELTPNALSCLLKAWDDIPREQWSSYREVVGCCQTHEGTRIGACYPANINHMSDSERAKALSHIDGEHEALLRTDTLKECPWPEAEGVTFVTEYIVWRKLNQKYRSWFVNDIVRIYHTDTADSITVQHKHKNIQHAINDLYRYGLLLREYPLSFSERLRFALLYEFFRWHLLKSGKMPSANWAHLPLRGVNRLISLALRLPTRCLLPLFRKKFCRPLPST